MKILFFTEYYYSFNKNGATSFSSSHLRYLRLKYPSDEIEVIYLGAETDFWKEQPDFANQNISVTKIPVANTEHAVLSIRILGIAFGTRKISTLIDSLFALSLSNQDLILIKNKISSTMGIRYIWCEHLTPLLYLNLLSLKEELTTKIVYSHHDFLYKILLKRRGWFKDIVRSFFIKRLELSLFKGLRYFVSGSASEIEFAKINLSKQAHCQLLPCIYPAIQQKNRGLIPSLSDKVKIYHLGTVSATANRIGLVSFMKNVFPKIEHLDFTLEFIGNVKDFFLAEFPEYIEHPKIRLHGFVENLDELIEEQMIHIIPYQGFTGTRTRIGNLIQYKPCLVGYTNMTDSYPILSNNENALVANDLIEFIELLKEGVKRKELRQRLSLQVELDFGVYEQGLLSKSWNNN